jgi:hypothetical protein
MDLEFALSLAPPYFMLVFGSKKSKLNSGWTHLLSPFSLQLLSLMQSIDEFRKIGKNVHK